jgi:nucleoside-diphosphate-sugar epimerase
MEANMLQNSSDPVVVFGYGPVGRAVTERLLARGRSVRVVQRRRPSDLAAGAVFQTCDVLDIASVVAAMAGTSQAVVAFGFEYSTPVWQRAWPQAMLNLLAACRPAGQRLVFVDNLYMYGPQSAPLTEDMALCDQGGKLAVRSAVTRLWQRAEQHGIRVAALRASDFYGPGVAQSHLGAMALGAVAAGRRAVLVGKPDMPHDFAYVPDIGRAVISLLEAPDDAYGQAWHMPCAPTRTLRELLSIAASTLGEPARIAALPQSLLPLAGVFSPMMREMVEMRFQWDRPYHVNADRFRERFWSDVTPFEVGIPQATRSFLPAASPKQQSISPQPAG